ncbi:MAG TPA: carboxylate--amine ligase [Deltaproteobacteria bacterium]|nr:carboxylate--amine ligase [Deltaproteobacteria bacterium]
MTVSRTLPPAVVTGVDYITGFNTLRSLSEEGVPLIGLSTDPASFLMKTARCSRIVVSSEEGLIESLIGLGGELEERAVLFPCTDSHVRLISENREILEPFYIFELPSRETVRLLLDKVSFHNFALRNEIPVPESLIVREVADSHRGRLEGLRFPCIVKPSIKNAVWEERYGKALKFRSASELSAAVPEMLRYARRLVVQEWIPGPDLRIYFCLMYFHREDEPAAYFVGRKIRQWPPEIGSTAVAEGRFNRSVLSESIRIFRKTGYRGIGSVEYKYDRRRGLFLVMEPTVGRPNLQSYVATANGINIPYIAFCNMVGRELSAFHREEDPTPVKWVHELSDFRSARHHMRRGDLTWREWFRSLSGPKKYALFSLADPLPFICTFFFFLSRFARKKLSSWFQGLTSVLGRSG